MQNLDKSLPEDPSAQVAPTHDDAPIRNLAQELIAILTRYLQSLPTVGSDHNRVAAREGVADSGRRVRDAAPSDANRKAANPAPDQKYGQRFGQRLRWNQNRLEPVNVSRPLPLALLQGVQTQKQHLLANTLRFVRGLPAQHALLWGARGCGKSALIKSVWQHVLDDGAEPAQQTLLIEFPYHEIATLNYLLEVIDKQQKKAIIFIDELAITSQATEFFTLKTILDGGLLNVIVYATANRRHVVARAMQENIDDITPHESIDANVSLSDRFGLWLGFYPISQDTWLTMLAGYCAHFFGSAAMTSQDVTEALQWQQQRGPYSGRLAWQYFLELAAARGMTAARLLAGPTERKPPEES